VIIKIKKEMVSKVIIINDDKILLLKRAKKLVTKDSPWTWDLPGGHIDKGEQPEQAAIRETDEETKIKISSLSYTGHDSNIGKKTHFYVTDDWRGDVKLSHEHEAYKWVKEADLVKYRENIGSMYYEMTIRALKTRK